MLLLPLPISLCRCAGFTAAAAASAVVLAFSFALDSAAGASYDDAPARAVVDTNLGTLVGRALPDGGSAFFGIPYALPPLGQLRFEPPVPLASWGSGKRTALEFGAECMQSTANNPSPPANVSEDCLFLNVWVPREARKKGAKLPVMVWLFGGGFQQGASSHREYDGKRLSDRGVVVVSVNYRLGALGWMVSVTDNLWGNYGLQDQRLGLEWVHDNIEAFGGDPGRVTLFGESAGAMSIGQHLHMDGAGVLFHQVIMQSNPIGYRFRSVTVANFLGEAMKRGLDCFSLPCLQNEPAAEIMRVQESLMGVPRSVGDFFTWGPVVTDGNYRRHVGKHQKKWNCTNLEDKKGGDDGRGDPRRGPNSDYTAPFMNVAQPLEVWENAVVGVSSAQVAAGVSKVAPGSAVASGGSGGTGRVGARQGRGRWRDEVAVPPPVPVMLGVNADEGVMFVHGAFPLTMPKLVYYSFVAALFRQSVVGVLRTYGYLADQCEASGDYRRVMSQIMHDYLFRCPNRRAAHLFQEQYGRASPVFVYEFSHPTEVPGFLACSGLSCHTAELPYVFDNMNIVAGQYSYHETSGAAAPAAPTLNEAGSSPRSADGDMPDDSDVSPRSFNPAGIVGSAWGAVHWGTVAAVKSGFGIGRFFGGGRRPPETSDMPDSVQAAADGSDPATATSSGETAGSTGLSGDTAGTAVVAAADGDIAGVTPSSTMRSGVEGDVNQVGYVAGEAVTEMDTAIRLEVDEVPDSRDFAEGASGAHSVAGAAATAAASSKVESATKDVGIQKCVGAGDHGLGMDAVGEGGDAAGANSCAATVGDVPVEGEARDSGEEGEASGSQVPEEHIPSFERPRPTVGEAAETDALVGDAMAWYWASFGKAGDPNSSRAPILWPAWEKRRILEQGDTVGAAAMAAIIAAGGRGEISFSGISADTWSQGGVGVEGAGRGWGTGGPLFLDIKARPEVKEAQRDCVCEFWDRVKYRY